jgi:5-methylcytosine-specific restriction endonuclease McrA
MPAKVREWEAAKLAGEQYYSTGKPCRNGHVARRYMASGKCAACEIAKSTRYNKRNLPKLAAYVRERRRENPVPHRVSSTKWRDENPEWTRTNGRLYRQRRRAKERENGGDGLTTAEVDALYARSRHSCALCGHKVRLELDHIMPLALGGRHEISNIQLLCRPCNRGKAKKHPDVWAREHGFLIV